MGTLDKTNRSSSTFQQMQRLLEKLPETQAEIYRLREEVKQQTEDRDFQTVVDWLSSLNFRTTQLDVFAQSQDGAVRWLLESDEFIAWLDKGPRTLLCWGLRECHRSLTCGLSPDCKQLVQTKPSFGKIDRLQK